MRRTHRSTSLVSVAVLVSLLVFGASVPVTGAAPADGATTVSSATAESATATRTIDLTRELRLTPDRPGEIAVQLRYSLPPDVVELRTRVPPDATVTATSGFVEQDGQYVWDQRTAAPTLTYRLPANETHDVTGPIAGTGDYVFVDRGEWALVRVPSSPTGWSWTGGGTVGLSRTTTTAGPGAVGEAVAYLGDHREVERTAHGQTFRLVIPAQADLAESPSAILDSMAAASDALRVGDRDERVFAVAAPTESIRWGVRGLQTGDSDMWVRDSERLDTADNVWLHEYVHTRQGYAADTETRWFTEASATYYAALLSLEQERVGFEAFRDRLALGRRDADAVLADPSTWNTVAPYTKGALVAGELDRQIRLSSDSRRSLQHVLARMNAHDGPVSESAFREFVRQAGGDDTATLAARYTTTGATPSMWNRTAHERAFGTIPARIGYALAGARVSGPYRNATVDATGPLRLAVGETLTVETRVRNTGGASGEYDARLAVDGEVVDRRTGTLGRNETTTLTFAHRFASAGTYTVSVGGRDVAVTVSPPAEPTVTAVGIEGPRATPEGAVVDVTATVANEQSFPAAGNLTLYRDGEPVATRRVTLAPETERTVRFEGLAVSPGEHVFRVADRTARVRVAATTTTTAEGADGFGVVPALLALACLFVRCRRPKR